VCVITPKPSATKSKYLHREANLKLEMTDDMTTMTTMTMGTGEEIEFDERRQKPDGCPLV
jgi:hypothetical protein